MSADFDAIASQIIARNETKTTCHFGGSDESTDDIYF